MGVLFDQAKNVVGNREKIVVISDKHEDILHKVKKVYLNIEHNYCMRHLLNNINKNFNDLTVDVNWKFINAAKASGVEEWEVTLYA